MALELEGRVKYIGPVITGQGARGEWKKRTFVITTLEQFPKDVAFVTWNEKAEALDNLKPGQRVVVRFALESRQFEDRWYTDARAWSIRVVREEDITGGTTGPDYTPTTQPPVTETATTEESFLDDSSDNLLDDTFDSGDTGPDLDSGDQDLIGSEPEDDLPF